MAAVAMILASSLTAALPVLIGALVNHSLSAHHPSFATAVKGLPLIGVLVVVAELLQVMRRQLVEAVATGFERDARDAAYQHLLRLDLETLRGNQVGRIYGRANRSIEGAVRLVKLGAMDLLPAATLAVLALVVAFTRAPLAAAAMAMAIPTGFALVLWQVSSQAGVRLQARDRKEDIDGQVVELLPALEVVRTTGAEGHFGSLVRATSQALRATELRHHRAMSMFDAAKAINEGLWLVIMLALTLGVTGGGTASAGEITALVLLYAGVTQPLGDLHRIIDEAAESAQQANDLFELLDEPEDASYSTRSGSPLTIDRSVSAVELSSVHFDYRGGEQRTPVLNGLDLSISAGERVGIVGASGGGKSTMLKLVCRLLHASSGLILIAGRDIRELARDDLDRLIGYVPQHAHIFRATVLENILLGASSSTLADAEDAARRAHLHQEILRLPEGYDTLVGERGETLSGGQRQRLSLARALVRRPPILLLDEATSSLDEESQAAVGEAIARLEDVTLLVVAHRISTLRSMDRIIALENGRCAETLAYDELLRRADLVANTDTDAATISPDKGQQGRHLVVTR